MKKFAFLILLICGSSFAESTFQDYAYQVLNHTWNGLYACRLSRVNPRDPRLPYRMVPARDAVVNYQWRLLAYYDEEWVFNANTMVFKNPDGSYRHTTNYDSNQISFATPYAGVVARANLVQNLGGNQVYYYCYNRQVSPQEFSNCVYSAYEKVITDQLCRFGVFR